MQTNSAVMMGNYSMEAYDSRRRRELVPAARWLKTW